MYSNELSKWWTGEYGVSLIDLLFIKCMIWTQRLFYLTTIEYMVKVIFIEKTQLFVDFLFKNLCF